MSSHLWKKKWKNHKSNSFFFPPVRCGTHERFARPVLNDPGAGFRTRGRQPSFTTILLWGSSVSLWRIFEYFKLLCKSTLRPVHFQENDQFLPVRLHQFADYSRRQTNDGRRRQVPSFVCHVITISSIWLAANHRICPSRWCVSFKMNGPEWRFDHQSA